MTSPVTAPTDLDYAAWRDELDPSVGIIEVAGETPDAPKRQVLADDAAADRALAKIIGYRAEVAEARAFDGSERARLDAWLVARTTRLFAEIDFFEGLLRAYFARRVYRELDGTGGWAKVTKTLKLPHGTLRASRSTIGSHVTDNEELAVDALARLDRYDLRETKVTVSAQKLKAAITAGTVRVADGRYLVRVNPRDNTAPPIADDAWTVVQDADGSVWVELPGVARDGVGQIDFIVETTPAKETHP